VALDAFYTGQKKTVLQPGEFIEAVLCPRPVAGRAFRAHKISKRFDQDISATCFAAAFELEGGVLRRVRVACNGLAPSPCRAPKMEAVLEGRAPAAVTGRGHRRGDCSRLYRPRRAARHLGLPLAGGPQPGACGLLKSR
jgi:xanthine dehydrogenase iron-sulfur cluster and FAD-binding subunit A